MFNPNVFNFNALSGVRLVCLENLVKLPIFINSCVSCGRVCLYNFKEERKSMKNRFKLIVCLLLAVLSVFVLVACVPDADDAEFTVTVVNGTGGG